MPQTAHSFQFTPELKSFPPLSYLLSIPAQIEKKSKARLPLILFLHGADERGSSLAKIKKQGLPKMLAQGRELPAIIVSPQCRAGEIWNADELLGLLDNLEASLPVDRARVSATGLSMGGYACWELGLRDPSRFSAIAPICGGASLIRCLLPEAGKAAALKRLPVWAFHGALDDVVPVWESEKIVEALRQSGNKARLTIYADLKHDCWTRAYEQEPLIEWLLAQKSKRK
jgi:predicted peptidase